MGLLALIVAFVAGNIVMWRIFLSRDKGAGELVSATIRAAGAGFLTMMGVLILLFGLAAALGITNP
jgi:hypothetical protein